MAKASKLPRTKAGSAITPQIADELAAEAECGYDIAGAKRHRTRRAEPTADATAKLPPSLDFAPWDDEELTEDDLRAVQAAKHEASVPLPKAVRATE